MLYLLKARDKNYLQPAIMNSRLIKGRNLRMAKKKIPLLETNYSP